MTKRKTVRIENWAVVPWDDGYRAPEVKLMGLRGAVYGHPEKPDGEMVDTTYLVASKGHTVKTRAGTYYELGTPDPDYLAWCKEHNIVIDPEWPVKVGDGEKWLECEDLTQGVN